VTTQTPTTLRVRRLRDDAVLPTRAHHDDAGLDLVSVDTVVLAPGGGRAVVGTGIAVEIPAGWAGLVCRRSGLAARHGVTVLGGPGVIDAGYRGELRVVLLNTDPGEAFTINAGDRVAQLLLTPVLLGDVTEVDELSDATRDAAGFGSTGGFG
jgi:dUTP pyrophosphatase